MLFLDLLQGDGVAYIGSGTRWNQIGRETVDADAISAAKYGGAFHHIAQFSDIARPVVFCERLEGLLCEAGEGVVVASAIEYQQSLRERHDVLRAFA